MTTDTGERELHAPVSGGEIVGWVRGDGPPVLLLHGGPGLSDYLDTLAAELSPIATVARYQQRGLAPSVLDGDRTVEGHAPMRSRSWMPWGGAERG